MKKWSSLIVLLAVMASACGTAAPAAAPTASPSPTLVPSVTSTATPSEVPTLTLTPTETLTPTPSTPMVQAVDKTVNCRYGPSGDYLPVGTLPPGQWVPIDATIGSQLWWRIELPSSPGTFCWIAASLSQTSGDLNQVQVVEPPGGLVTGVNLSLETALVHGPCSGSNTNRFTGTVSTNGPGEIFYVWEIDGGGMVLDSTSPTSLVFHTAGTQAVNPWSFTGGCGQYTVKLFTVDPNTKIATASYQAEP